VAFVLLLPPLIWLKGLASPWVAGLLLVVGLTQWFGARTGFNRIQAVLALGVALFVAVGSQRLTLYYPAMVNGTLLVLWGHSWLYPPTIIERLAPADHTAVARKRRYMRGLTLAWCAVFSVNLLIALITAQLRDLTWWVAWNGLGAYLLVGIFAGGEYLFRMWRLDRETNQGPTA